MKDFIWKASKRALKATDLFKDPYQVFYVLESCLPKLCSIDSLDIEPGKYNGKSVKIKKVTEYIAKANETTGFVIEEGAEFIIPLYYIYLHVTSCGNEPIFEAVTSVTLKNGEFSCVQASESATKQLKMWTKKAADFIEVALEENAANEQSYKQVTFEAEIEDTMYVGETIDMEISGEMTLSDFQNRFAKIYGATPVIIKQRKEVKDGHTLLKDIGIKGKTIIKIEPYLSMGEINDSLLKQLCLSDINFFFKFNNRPWAYMLGNQLLAEVDKLPSIWKSIEYNILIKIAIIAN